ncbi:MULTISPECIES: hypothetical protein, partial [unclassified Mesorhizobium]|uniref:hypothetical protein n=1 Tax=unclassified Mesorhizobium TaxID=325217 RepID=UPI0030151F0D
VRTTLRAQPRYRALLAQGGPRRRRTAKVAGNPISGAYWPLTLELVHLGMGEAKWLEEAPTPILRKLHAAKASIIEWTAPPKVFLESEDSDDMDPDYAIEDYGADYGGDEGESDEEALDEKSPPAVGTPKLLDVFFELFNKPKT